MRHTFLILFAGLMLWSTTGKGQEAVVVSDSMVMQNGESFRVHHVIQKQTLYSIAKAYGVQMNQIAFANPGILDGLKTNSYILIPAPKVEAAPASGTMRSDGRHLLYTVPPKMTLYSIAKAHEVTMSELIDLNPELNDGLKEGMTIRIPVKPMVDTTVPGGIPLNGQPAPPPVADPVSKGSGSISDIRPMTPTLSGSDTVNIALLLPLYLDQNDSIRSKWWPGLEPQIEKRSGAAIEFLEGALLALDSLSKSGHKVRVKVLDTERSPAHVQGLFTSGQLTGTDLIIGPLYGDEFVAAATEAQKLNMAIVSPTIQGKDIAKDNGLVLKAMTSHERMITELGRYVGGLDSVRAGYIIHYNRPDDQYLLWRFKQGMDAGANGGRPPALPMIDLSHSTRDSLQSVLSRKEVNHLVMLTNDQARIASLLREVHRWAEQYRIVMYVPDTWLGFKNLDIYYLDKMQATYAANDYFNRNAAASAAITQKCMDLYATEPSDLTLRGYDMFMHLVPQARSIRANGSKALDKVTYQGVMQEFRWSLLPNGALENTDTHVLRMNELRLLKVD